MPIERRIREGAERNAGVLDPDVDRFLDSVVQKTHRRQVVRRSLSVAASVAAVVLAVVWARRPPRHRGHDGRVGARIPADAERGPQRDAGRPPVTGTFTRSIPEGPPWCGPTASPARGRSAPGRTGACVLLAPASFAGAHASHPFQMQTDTLATDAFSSDICAGLPAGTYTLVAAGGLPVALGDLRPVRRPRLHPGRAAPGRSARSASDGGLPGRHAAPSGWNPSPSRAASMAGPPGTRSGRGARGSPPGSPRTCSRRSGRRSTTGRSSISGAGPAIWRSARSLGAPREPRASTWAPGRSKRRERWPGARRRRSRDVHGRRRGEGPARSTRRRAPQPRPVLLPGRRRAVGQLPVRRAVRVRLHGPALGGLAGIFARAETRMANVWFRIRDRKFRGFRVYVHDLGAVDRRVREAGFLPSPRVAVGWSGTSRSTNDRPDRHLFELLSTPGRPRGCGWVRNANPTTTGGTQMRLRTFVGLVAMCTIAGSILAASSASAYQLRSHRRRLRPRTQLPSTPTSTTSTSVTAVAVAAATAPCPSSGAIGRWPACPS